MTLSQYLTATGMSIYALQKATKLSYTALWRHLHGKSRLSIESAKRLEKFDSRLSASEIVFEVFKETKKSKATKRRAAA